MKGCGPSAATMRLGLPSKVPTSRTFCWVRKLSGKQFVATYATWQAEGFHITVTDSLQTGDTGTQEWHFSSRVAEYMESESVHLTIFCGI